MAKEFIVDGAPCMCKHGASPGKLKVSDNSFFMMNGSKLSATTMTLGNAMYPPAFGVCKINPAVPKPCVPAITKWSGQFSGLKTSSGGYPLTDESKGTCGSGTPDCIQFMQTGQIPVPGPKQLAKATAEHQGELDPMGEPAALTPHQISMKAELTPGSSQKVLVQAVKGAKETLAGQKIRYQVTKYNIDAPPAEVKTKVKWRVEIDGKELSITQPNNDVLELQIKNEWECKEITVMPYLKKYTPDVSVKTKVKVEAVIVFVNGYWNSGESNLHGDPITAIGNMRLGYKVLKKLIAENIIGTQKGAGYWESQYKARDYFRRKYKEWTTKEISNIEYVYYDGSSNWYSSGERRWNDGWERHKKKLDLINDPQLKDKKVFNDKGEQQKLLFFVTHSMGAAHAEGMISSWKYHGVKIECVLHFSAADNSDFGVTIPHLTWQINLLPDPVLIFKNDDDARSAFWQDVWDRMVDKKGYTDPVPNFYMIKKMRPDHYIVHYNMDHLNHYYTKTRKIWDVMEVLKH